MLVMAHARPRGKLKVRLARETEELGSNQQKARKSALFLRKIPVSCQIEDIRSQMKKCPGILT